LLRLQLPPPVRPRTVFPSPFVTDGSQSGTCASERQHPHLRDLCDLPIGRRASREVFASTSGGKSDDGGDCVAVPARDRNHITFRLEPPLQRPVLAQDMAVGTMFDLRFCGAGRGGHLAGRGPALDVAIHTLGAKLFTGVYYFLAGGEAAGMADILGHVDLEAVARHLLEQSCRGQATRRLAIRGHKLVLTRGPNARLVTAIAGFLRLVPTFPRQDAIDRYLRQCNAGLEVCDQLTMERLKDIFAVRHFVALQARDWEGDCPDTELHALFRTSMPFASASFGPKALSNGQIVSQNQLPIIISELFFNLKLQRLSAREWFVVLGLLQERLLALHITGSLALPKEQVPVAAEFLEAVLQRMQAACAQAADGDVRAALDGAIEQVISERFPAIQQELWQRYDLDREPEEDLGIPLGRYGNNDRDTDRARRLRKLEARRSQFASKEAMWATVGEWMRIFLECASGSIDVSTACIARHDDAQAVRMAFNDFLLRFRDVPRATREMRPPDHIPVEHMDPKTGACDRYLYLSPLVAWHFLRKACGDAEVDPALSEIWEQLRVVSGMEGRQGDFAFEQSLFDLSLAELRKNANFIDQDRLFAELASCRLNLQAGRVTRPVFQRRVLALLKEWEKRADFRPSFDEEFFLQQEGQDAFVWGVPGARLDRDKYIFTPDASADGSQSGDWNARTDLGPVRRLNGVHRALQRELARDSKSPGSPDAAGMPADHPADCIERGQLLDAIRLKAFTGIRGIPAT